MSRRLLLILPVLLASGCSGCWELVTGSEAQVRRALRSLSPVETQGVHLDIAFISESIEVEGRRAVAFARGEADGTWNGVPVSSICVEAVPFVRTSEGWRSDGFPLPRLQGVLTTLEARHQAFGAGDLDGYLALVHPEYRDGDTDREALRARLAPVLADPDRPAQRVVSWTLRVERGEAVVTEGWVLDTEEGPVEGRARYHLAPQGDGWRFTSGLM